MPLRGGYTRMKTAYLTGLPMPLPSAATQKIAELVRRGTSLGALDEQVRLAYALPRSLWEEGYEAGSETSV